MNSIGFPGSELVESILPDPGRFEVEFTVQSAIDFEARSIKLFCMLFCEALVLSKVSKLSMAVVSTVVVDPVSELIDSVVIGCEGVGLPMLVVEVALALLVVVEAKLIDLAGINMLMSSGLLPKLHGSGSSTAAKARCSRITGSANGWASV